jgi:hypothetical protein
MELIRVVCLFVYSVVRCYSCVKMSMSEYFIGGFIQIGDGPVAVEERIWLIVLYEFYYTHSKLPHFVHI